MPEVSHRFMPRWLRMVHALTDASIGPEEMPCASSLLRAQRLSHRGAPCKWARFVRLSESRGAGDWRGVRVSKTEAVFGKSTEAHNAKGPR